MGRRVLIAEDRAARPSDFGASKTVAKDPTSQADCPFCVGHEMATPHALIEVTDRDGRWQVRVVPNKFPAVSLDQSESTRPGVSALGQFSLRPEGVHEVFIESPRHVQDITELSLAELARVVLVMRDRLRYGAPEEKFKHVTIFKNVGPVAGASLEHIHSQLVALPDVPPAMATKLQGCLEYYTANQACLICQLLDEELTHRARLVVADGPFVALSAYAARQPYEVWIVPRQHGARFEQLSDMDAEALATALQQVVERLQTRLAPLSYNLVLHTAPYRGCFDNYYHWHFELIPRSTPLAGFEWGTGMHINPLAPERAAARLRGTSQR